MRAGGELALIQVREQLRKPLGYVLGAALFGCAFVITSSGEWFRSHYPYLAYFIASLVTCYLVGIGPANLVAVLSAATVYVTFAPSGFFVSATQTPLAASLAVLALFLACNGLLGSLKRSRDRLAAERERYALLAESRDVLYRELQHRVSNNITVISGLLQLQSQAVTDVPARRALSEASSRIHLIARIQRQLHDQSGAPMPFCRFAEEMLAVAIAAAGAEDVQVKVLGGEAPLQLEQATPVSLVMLECVNNALEHGFGPGRGGAITVRLAQIGGEMLLTVSDNGRGLPDGFDLEGAQSLGLKIVRTMARQLHGEFSIVRGDPGSICRLSFPAKG